MNVELLLAIAAIITAVGGILGSVLASNRKLAVIETELKEVQNRLDAHNGYASKFASTTESLSSMKTDIAVIKTKLEFIAKAEQAD